MIDQPELERLFDLVNPISKRMVGRRATAETLQKIRDEMNRAVAADHALGRLTVPWRIDVTFDANSGHLQWLPVDPESA